MASHELHFSLNDVLFFQLALERMPVSGDEVPKNVELRQRIQRFLAAVQIEQAKPKAEGKGKVPAPPQEKKPRAARRREQRARGAAAG